MKSKQNKHKSASFHASQKTIPDHTTHTTGSAIKHKFMVISSSAGVGKTSVIVNVAVALSKMGAQVGVMDLNIYDRKIQRMLGIASVVEEYSDNFLIPIALSDNLKVASIKSVLPASDQTGNWQRPLTVSDIRKFMTNVNWGNLDYLLVDAPPGPGEALRTVIRAFSDAKIIIVTAPYKIAADRAKKMIHFFRNEHIQISGWIENMRGYLCQQCGQIEGLFDTGSPSRAIFLMNVPFLGRIPVDPHLGQTAGAGEIFQEIYPHAQLTEAYELIAQKIMATEQ